MPLKSVLWPNYLGAVLGSALSLWATHSLYLGLINFIRYRVDIRPFLSPQAPRAWPDLLGRSQWSDAPISLPQGKKRLLVTNVTGTQAAMVRGEGIGNGNGRAPVRPQIGGALAPIAHFEP